MKVVTVSKRIFKNAREFEKSMGDYLASCMINKALPNIAGYCVFANINRDTFYAQQEYYSDTYKKVNDMLEDAVIGFPHANDAMKIFYMKNKFGYRDRFENVNTTSLEIKTDLSKLSDEELEQLKELTKKVEI